MSTWPILASKELFIQLWGVGNSHPIPGLGSTVNSESSSPAFAASRQASSSCIDDSAAAGLGSIGMHLSHNDAMQNSVSQESEESADVATVSLGAQAARSSDSRANAGPWGLPGGSQTQQQAGRSSSNSTDEGSSPHLHPRTPTQSAHTLSSGRLLADGHSASQTPGFIPDYGEAAESPEQPRTPSELAAAALALLSYSPLHSTAQCLPRLASAQLRAEGHFVGSAAASAVHRALWESDTDSEDSDTEAPSTNTSTSALSHIDSASCGSAAGEPPASVEQHAAPVKTRVQRASSAMGAHGLFAGRGYVPAAECKALTHSELGPDLSAGLLAQPAVPSSKAAHGMIGDPELVAMCERLSQSVWGVAKDLAQREAQEELAILRSQCQALESDVQDREGALLEWEKRCKVLERRLAWERATFGLERENLRLATCSAGREWVYHSVFNTHIHTSVPDEPLLMSPFSCYGMQLPSGDTTCNSDRQSEAGSEQDPCTHASGTSKSPCMEGPCDGDKLAAVRGHVLAALTGCEQGPTNTEHGQMSEVAALLQRAMALVDSYTASHS